MDVRINVNSSGYHSFGESIHSRVFPLLDAMKKFVYYTLPMFFKISEPFSLFNPNPVDNVDNDYSQYGHQYGP